jgi:hypothetical protein
MKEFMHCQWCGRDFYADGRWTVNGKGTFCSQKCCDEWKWEKGGGKEDAQFNEGVAQKIAELEQSQAEYDRRQKAAVANRAAHQNAERDHFRPFIEERVGHPLKLEDVWYNLRLQTWVAREELLAELSAAMKALEKQTGVPVSTFFPIQWENAYYVWCDGDAADYKAGWNFILPQDKSLLYFSDPMDPLDLGEPSCSPMDWGIGVWNNAESVSPYIALARYEGRNIQDVTDIRQYAWLKDNACLVSFTEVKQKLQWQKEVDSQSTMENTVSIRFIPSKDLFRLTCTKYKARLFKEKSAAYTERFHRDVSLDALQVRIPV